MEDWIVRLRSKLATTVCVPPPLKRVKPQEQDLPLPKLSCGHPAGSDGKIEVMRARAERGESLFHPADNREIRVRQSHCARVG
jgi:hypothetical protein